MKEELLKFKSEVKEFANTTNKFVKRREIFNFEVKEALEEMEIEEFFSGNIKDSYSRACKLYEYEEDLINIVETLKIEHPKYGENRIKILAKKQYLSDLVGTLGESFIEYVDRVLNLYFLYENYGFSKVRALELKMNEMALDMKNEAKSTVDYVVKNSDVIWEESKGKAGDVLTKTRRRIGRFLLDLDKDK